MCAPDDTGEVFFEPFAVSGTNDRYGELALIFSDPSTRIGVGTAFRVPDNYVGTPKITILWSANATTGTAVWDVAYTSIDAGETSDPNSDQETVTTTVAVPGTAFYVSETQLALTAGNFAAGDLVKLGIFRDGTDASDTLSAKAIVQGLFFEYADA
jgi:hypothetical protein